MTPRQLRDDIFHLMLEMDLAENPNEMVRIQFAMEDAYRSLVNLTGISQQALESAILSQYENWLKGRGEDTPPPTDPEN